MEKRIIDGYEISHAVAERKQQQKTPPALDANAATYLEAALWGKTVLFSADAIDRKTLPPGIYAYDLSDPGAWDIPDEIADTFTCDRMGTVLTAEKIDLGRKQCKSVEGAFAYYEGTDGNPVISTLARYMQTYPEKKKPQKRRKDDPER